MNFDHDDPFSDEAVDMLLAQVHVGVQHDLASTLPIEDGLAALIGSEPVSSISDLPEFTRVVERIAALPLRERLVIRPLLPTASLIQAQSIARWLLHAHDIYRVLALNTPRAVKVVHGLIRDIGRDHDLKLDRTYTAALTLAEALVLRPGIAHKEAHMLVVGLARDLNMALDRVYVHALELDRAADLAVVRAIRLDLGGTNKIHLRRAITRLRAYVDGVDVLVRAVDNVEGADLTQIDLGDLHLTGVRWSEFTTRWPPEWEEPVRRASVRIDQDRGLWEIRDDPRTHARRHTQVPV